MMTNNVKYISEEEKRNDFRKAMEEERRYSRKCQRKDKAMSRLMGGALLMLGVFFLCLGGEGIIGTILCVWLGITALCGSVDEE